MKTKSQPDQIINKCIPLATLRPHPRNYNQHDEAQIGDLRLSLRTFGQVRSIVVQALTRGRNSFLTVAGHGLVAAARLEGFTELRADVIPAKWDETLVLAYLAADNELAKRANPDEAQLAKLAEDVERERGAGLAALAAGSEERLKELRASLAQAETDGKVSNDEIPEQWMIVIECSSEQHQKQLLEQFMSEGLKCRALIS
jgi:ParB-like chromosome segregation protein Spo0J